MILHIPPWELAERSSCWVNWTLIANAALIEAQNEATATAGKKD
jgi:hypothetical protein